MRPGLDSGLKRRGAEGAAAVSGRGVRGLGGDGGGHTMARGRGAGRWRGGAWGGGGGSRTSSKPRRQTPAVQEAPHARMGRVVSQRALLSPTIPPPLTTPLNSRTHSFATSASFISTRYQPPSLLQSSPHPPSPIVPAHLFPPASLLCASQPFVLSALRPIPETAPISSLFHSPSSQPPPFFPSAVSPYSPEPQLCIAVAPPAWRLPLLLPLPPLPLAWQQRLPSGPSPPRPTPLPPLNLPCRQWRAMLRKGCQSCSLAFLCRLRNGMDEMVGASKRRCCQKRRRYAKECSSECQPRLKETWDI